MENKTPPMGEPKATATPAALAAVITSRILPMKMLLYLKCYRHPLKLTLASGELPKHPGY
jgi:hypothetical protein